MVTSLRHIMGRCFLIWKLPWDHPGFVAGHSNYESFSSFDRPNRVSDLNDSLPLSPDPFCWIFGVSLSFGDLSFLIQCIMAI